MKKNQQGVTLIELMVVVAIMGIIMAVAYPSYVNHVLRSNRVAAEACLTEIAQVMERGYTAAFSYEALNLPALGCIDELGERYTFNLSNQAARTFNANAVPTGPQTADTCGALVLTQAGAKGANGSFAAATVRECW